MPQHDEGSELYAVIRRICDEHRELASLSPSWLAMEAMQRIGFARGLHDLGWIGCNLQFRQIARAYCRKHFDPVDGVGAVTPDLFPDTLQERYPLPPRGEAEPEYVLLDLLAEPDIDYNEARLRKGADALTRHADALKAFKRRKFGRSVA